MQIVARMQQILSIIIYINPGSEYRHRKAGGWDAELNSTQTTRLRPFKWRDKLIVRSGQSECCIEMSSVSGWVKGGWEN